MMKLKITIKWPQRLLTQPHFRITKTVINIIVLIKTSVKDTVLDRDIIETVKKLMTNKVTKVIILLIMKVPTYTIKMTTKIQNQLSIMKEETSVQNIEMITTEMITAEMTRDIKSTPIVGRRTQVTMMVVTTMVQTHTTQMNPTAAIKNHPVFKKGC